MRALAGIALIAVTPLLAETPDAKLARLTVGKVAAAPVDCIRPDFSVNPEIVDGTAIVYRAPGMTYVNRMNGDCAQLRDDRQIRISTLAGRLCRTYQVRIVQPPGSTDYGFCTFGPFVPYRKPGNAQSR